MLAQGQLYPPVARASPAASSNTPPRTVYLTQALLVHTPLPEYQALVTIFCLGRVTSLGRSVPPTPAEGSRLPFSSGSHHDLGESRESLQSLALYDNSDS